MSHELSRTSEKGGRLLVHADELLHEAARLRVVHRVDDIDALRKQLVVAIKAFVHACRADGIEEGNINAARYALCTLLDEVIATSSWGRRTWGRSSLLMHFHHDSTGGTRFFDLLDACMAHPTKRYDVLDLMHRCLSLGLKGRYRIQPQGDVALALRRRQVYDALQSRLRPRHRTPRRHVEAFWILGIVLGIGLIIEALVLTSDLRARGDTIMTRVHALGRTTPSPAIPRAGSPWQRPFELATVMAHGDVQLQEDAHQLRLIPQSSAFFAPGKADLLAPGRSVLEHLVPSIASWRGDVRIIGYSDSTPTRRGDSNLRLSEARAQSVERLFREEHIPARSIQVEGRGTAEPRRPNDTPDHRAQNRRVEIVLVRKDRLDN